MIYKNKETGREVDTFDCSDRRCDNCPVGKKYPEEGFMNCGDYVRAHEEEALALLGYYPVEEEPEKKPEPVKQEEDKQVIRCILVLTETEVAHLLQASMNDGMTGADYLVKLLQNDIVCKKTWR